MVSKLNFFKHKHFDYSMLRWGLVGSLTTAVDYLLFVNLYELFNSVFFSNLVSASISTSLNYIFHHRWTFKSTQNHSKSGARYIFNLFFWWLISTSSIKLLIELGLDPKVAKLIPILLIAPMNYFILNILIFKKKS